MSLRRPKLVLVKSSSKRDRSLAKGIAAGLIGGLVATAARSFVERVYPPHPHDDPKQPKLPSKTSASALTLREKLADSSALHWGIGAAAGAAYGAVAEYYPPATSKDGASFGMTLAALSQDGALAAIGLAPRPTEHTTRERSSQLASFVVFGVVTETVRRIARKLL